MRTTYKIISAVTVPGNFTSLYFAYHSPNGLCQVKRYERKTGSFLEMVQRHKRSVTFSDNLNPGRNLPRMRKEVGVLADAHSSIT